MTHDILEDGSCSCGALKSCRRCGAPMKLIGYDNEPRYGVGHVWDTECAHCDDSLIEPYGGEG